MRSSVIRLRAISPKIPQLSIIKIILKITYLKLLTIHWKLIKPWLHYICSTMQQELILKIINYYMKRMLRGYIISMDFFNTSGCCSALLLSSQMKSKDWAKTSLQQEQRVSFPFIINKNKLNQDVLIIINSKWPSDDIWWHRSGST